MGLKKSLISGLLMPITRILTKKVEGLENIPKKGFVLASNHVSFIDSAFLMYVFKKHAKKNIVFLGEKMYFKKSLFGFFVKGFDTIKLDSHKGLREGENKKAYAETMRVLKKEGILGIYPEGKRSKDGKIQKGKTGVVRIAFRAKKPILPVRVKGTFGIWPVGQKCPIPKNRVSISIGKPISLEKYYGKESRAVYRRLTNNLMTRIKKL